MAFSKIERCQELARLVGIPLMEADIPEVAERFDSVMRALRCPTLLHIVFHIGKHTMLHSIYSCKVSV